LGVLESTVSIVADDEQNGERLHGPRPRLVFSAMTNWVGFERDTFSTVMPAGISARLKTHLNREDGQEDLCFVLWQPSLGRSRASALIFDVVLPDDGERLVHGNASFESEYFARSAAIARELRCGLGFIHSHPGARNWQELSLDDFAAESGIAAQSEVLTGLPLLGLTVATATDSYSGRFWRRIERRRFEPQWCETVRVVGKRLRVNFNPQLRPEPSIRSSQVRTVSAWGQDIQADLARLNIGVIGAGSVGALVAESLARTGVAGITLYDFDVVEQKNLDRLLHATIEDAMASLPKVEVLRRALLKSSTAANPEIRALEISIVEPDGFADALDMDVLFCCADRPWGRQVANCLAYVHLIPVVDGGVQVELTSTRMRGAEWRAHIATVDRCCLECLGQFDPADVSLERSGLLDDPQYILNLAPGASALPSGENVFAFAAAAAAAEVLQFLASFVQPAGVDGIDPQLFHFVNGKVDLDYRACSESCLYSGIWLGRGDSLDITVTGRHHAAERIRMNSSTRVQSLDGARSRVMAMLRRLRTRRKEETR